MANQAQSASWAGMANWIIAANEIWAYRTESMASPLGIVGYNCMEDRYVSDHELFSVFTWRMPPKVRLLPEELLCEVFRNFSKMLAAESEGVRVATSLSLSKQHSR